MKVDRSILMRNDQNMGDIGDPDKLEDSIDHLANVIDDNAKTQDALVKDNNENKSDIASLKNRTVVLETDNASNKQRIGASENKISSVQNQVNQLVVSGDSSVEAAQARVREDGKTPVKTFPTLQARLNDTDAQLVEKASKEELANKADKEAITVFSMTAVGADASGNTDSTEVFNDLVNNVAEGSTIVFPKGVYKGNFISSKTLTLDFQGSTVINESDSSPLVGFLGNEIGTYTVVDNPKHGDKSFTLQDAAGVSIGDIGYLYDESIRPSDNTPKVNVELVKVASIEGNVVTVFDVIRSDMNTGIVKFVKLNKIENPIVKDLVMKPSESHGSNGLHFFGCENPYSENISIEGFSRHGVRHEYCYNPKSRNPRFIEPRLVGSGEGYGLTFKGCRIGYAENIYGENCRHVVDMSTSYFCKVRDIKAPANKGLPVYLSHNGFGGYNEVDGLNAVYDSSFVSVSKQGIQDEAKHVMRGYRIRNIRGVLPTLDNASTFYGVYIQSDYSDIVIENVDFTFLNPVNVPNSNNTAVRVVGNQRGNISVSNVTVNRIGAILRAETRDGTSHGGYAFNINRFTAIKEVGYAVYLRGVESPNIGSINLIESTTALDYLIYIVPLYGLSPKTVNFIDDNITYVNNMFEISGVPATGLKGRAPIINGGSSASVSISAGGSIVSARVLGSGSLIRINSPTTGGAVTLNATEPIAPPLWMGQTVRLMVLGGRVDVVVPVGGTVVGTSNITMTPQKVYEFVGYGGSWYLRS